MLYGRLDDNNTIVEVIDKDPVGRYPAEIKWANIPDDFGLLTTKDKNTLLQEIRQIKQDENSQYLGSIEESLKELNDLKLYVQTEVDKYAEVNGVDLTTKWWELKAAEAAAADAARAAEIAALEEAAAAEEEAPSA